MYIKIKNKHLGNFSKPYIIAEIGSNFNQSFQTAIKLIDAAKKAGANAAKFQLFDAEELYNKSHPLFKPFKQNELNKNWIKKLLKYTESINLDFFLSVFDLKSADIAFKAGVEHFKIASSEVTNLKLIHAIDSFEKNIYLSTGMSDYFEIEKALHVINLNKKNKTKVVIMHCSSLYPCSDQDVNLNIINEYKKRYDMPIGFSDHTLGNLASILAVSKGVCFFEKHITLNKQSKGPDHFYALEPIEFKKYVDDLKRSFLICGNSKKTILESEKLSNRKKGIYANKNLKINHKITIKDLKFDTPQKGVSVDYKNIFINSFTVKKINKGEPLNFNDINLIKKKK